MSTFYNRYIRYTRRQLSDEGAYVKLDRDPTNDSGAPRGAP